MAELALLLLTVAWGSSFLIVKDLLRGTSVGVFLSLRFALAAAVMGVAWVMGRSRPTPRLWRDGTWLGVFLLGGFILQTEGLRYTTPARSGFLTGLTVLLVPLVARFALGRHLPSRVWAASLVALAGLAVLTRPWDGAVGPDVRWGDALTVLCAASFALHIVFTGEWAARHAIAPLTVTQLAVVAAGATVLAAIEPARVGPPGRLAAVILFTALVVTALAYSVQTWAQRRVSAVRAALIFALEPVIAAAVAARWGRDPVTAWEWIGGVVIVVGVAVGELGPREPVTSR